MRLFYKLYDRTFRFRAMFWRVAGRVSQRAFQRLGGQALRNEVAQLQSRVQQAEDVVAQMRSSLGGLVARQGEGEGTARLTFDRVTNHLAGLSTVVQETQASCQQLGQESAQWKQKALQFDQVAAAVGGLSAALVELRNQARQEELKTDHLIAALRTELSVIGETALRLQHKETELSRRLVEAQEEGHNALSFAQGIAAKLGEEVERVRGELSVKIALLEGELDRARGKPSALEAERYDRFYLDFEDRFRGSREQIHAKVSDYVPTVVKVGAGVPGREILDMGCGRGEWLEILQQRGLLASGVDLNGAMVRECTERGLRAVQADAIEYLRGLGPESLGAISAFHLVEHVSLDQLLTLLAEVERVLVSGGVVILETPNPQNLIVGSCNFYIDPTHRNPIPPMTLSFMVERAGFSEIQVIPKHPFDPMHHFPAPRTETEERLNSFFFGAQDYVVLGIKSPRS